ncbi:I78 family peptidase inhibitor [Streptomyces sannanensis]|uniref:I78 family peptidase inhibitor n=1 Tax=Streptomyces sannanensis TaxID=285536 RepID=A0ABP6S718_9ACTN
MASIPIPPAQSDDAPESYVGLDAEAAKRLARVRGWTTVRALPPGAIITMEYLAGRLNFEVDGGRVVRCWKG